VGFLTSVGYHQRVGREPLAVQELYQAPLDAWQPGSTSETRDSNRQGTNRSRRRAYLATCTGADGDVSTPQTAWPRAEGRAGGHAWVRCCPVCSCSCCLG